MTLTAHAIVGAGIMAAMPAHPVLGGCAAFASHFLLDAIPHYDYRIRSASINPKIGAPMRFNRALLLDFFSIGGDFTLGIILGILFFATPATWWLIAAGAFAGTLPDALQFVYMRIHHEPFVSLQRFHKWIHTRIKLREHPLFGIASQVLFLVVFVALARMTIL
jgi:hypothetical protein